MNQHLQNILNFIQLDKNLSDEAKSTLTKSLENANKEFELTAFKLDRTEKIKRTTAILLEETIEELEQKQKAVLAQNRELEIEASLEKVRSRTSSMQKSEELADVAEILFKQVRELGIHPWTAGFNIWMEGNEKYIDWITDPSGGFVEPYTVDLTIHPGFRQISDAKKNGEDFKVFEISGTELVETYELLTSFAPKQFAKMKAIAGNSFPSRQFNHYFFGTQVGLMFITPEPHPEDWDIFKRFGKVFEQTYTRFLDLQKAEAQVKEAQIESALERVRSKTMAMHNSQDVGDTVVSMFDELIKLGIDELERCGIGIMHEPDIMEAWTAAKTNEAKAELVIGNINMNIHPLLQKTYEGWVKKKEVFQYILEGEDKFNYYQIINNQPEYSPRSDISSKSNRVILTAFYFTEGYLYAFSVKELSSETAKIFMRFAGVFGQTYRRYLDLQKAEAQAREAEIELALEKVRSKAMAMHSSNDLSVAANTVFAELKNLGIHSFRSGVGLITKNSRMATVYATTSTEGKDSLTLMGTVELTGHESYEGQYNAWLKKEMYVSELKGAELERYYTSVNSNFQLNDASNKHEKEYGYYFPFSEGLMYSWSILPYKESEIKILNRFVAIIDLTFRRYIELQNSEVRAAAAVREASLHRVRGEIASMRNAEDLEQITPLVWRELTTLGVPFFRCGLFIVDEAKAIINFYLSNPDGKPLAALELPFQSITITKDAIANWRLQKVYKTHWNQEDFISFANSLLEQGQINNTSTYQGGEEAPESLTLHFIPFKEGMLYVGSVADLNDIQLESVKALADAFSTAYARYEDFIKLETAKQQIEKTLDELKNTQKQLIQSEKMASLGELTAGIAHEIQNPLNFVNNFSEVSTELVDEMNEEIQKGNMEDAKQIAQDLKENLEKINHHGKRAGDIVRGMLQHSRSSSGQKEPTDINALADEYLRLAYHGLRAKDKTFNATMHTDFDESMGKINIIPQDIGRVILNLITNAFYVVDEKKKSGLENYEPTVSVSTKKIADKILISVKDNGNGIPAKVLDKIFQPFFTTKPTGQGTGLGLSLSYDIVKAHGGEFTVDTKEGEGTTFQIRLSV